MIQCLFIQTLWSNGQQARVHKMAHLPFVPPIGMRIRGKDFDGARAESVVWDFDSSVLVVTLDPLYCNTLSTEDAIRQRLTKGWLPLND
jgi:hypothetical protein